MAAFRPGAQGLNCEQCGVDLHGEREVEQGLCEHCADSRAHREGDDWPAGDRWVHRLWGDIQSVPEDVAREALHAPKHDLPQEVAAAIETILRWRLGEPVGGDGEGGAPRIG